MTLRSAVFALAFALLAAGGWFLYAHRHHFTPRGVVRCAIGSTDRDEIAALFTRAPPAVRHAFDFGNCVDNHGALASHGYRLLSLTSRRPDAKDLADYGRPGFLPETMIDVLLYDPYLRRPAWRRYPCIRTGGWWYIMETWAGHPDEPAQR